MTFLEVCDWIERQLASIEHYDLCRREKACAPPSAKPVTAILPYPDGVWDLRLKWRSGIKASLLEALRKQLGLDLSEKITTVEYIVVDKVEKPSEGCAT